MDSGACWARFCESYASNYTNRRFEDRTVDQFNNPTVRGERVTILGQHQDADKDRSVLGSAIDGANVLVEYPDGERGYVSEDQINEAAE